MKNFDLDVFFFNQLNTKILARSHVKMIFLQYFIFLTFLKRHVRSTSEDYKGKRVQSNNVPGSFRAVISFAFCWCYFCNIFLHDSPDSTTFGKGLIIFIYKVDRPLSQRACYRFGDILQL